MTAKLGKVSLLAILLLVLTSISTWAATTYQYDDLHRLTRVSRSDGSVTVYNYDDFGNRTSLKSSSEPLVILSPNGDETLILGQACTISWGTNILAPVNLHLYKGDVDVLTIAENIDPASLSYTFILPESLEDGGNYRIRISRTADNTIFDFSDAVFVITAGSTAQNLFVVACGSYHTVVVKSDGTLWAWGENWSGQLGDGTTVNKSAPVQVGSDTDWQTVVCSSSHTVALKSDGTLWTWGYNSYGQLGDGTTVNKSVPVQVGSDTDWQTVTCGSSHTMAIKSDGTLWAWGYNGYGQLGDGTTVNKSVPVQVGSDAGWQTVACGSSHTVAIKSDGTLWAWGSNHDSQLGDGTTENKSIPVKISNDNDWKMVSAGWRHTTAIKRGGTLWTWGSIYFFSCDDGVVCSKFTIPAQIGGATDWQAVSVGGSRNVAIKEDGTLWWWGDNYLATPQVKTTPVHIGNACNWYMASTGWQHTIALKSDGTLWAWGNNSNGQLGDGSRESKLIPVQIGSNADWQTVACGSYHTVAVKNDGTMWAWGSNSDGQLGDGTTINKLEPGQIDSAGNWIKVSSGNNYTMAIKSDGTLWAWGYNWIGQLGDGTTENKSAPVQVGSDADWQTVACGGTHTVAIKSDGTLWAWGNNSHGQLGDGTTENKSAPVQVGSDTDWQTVACGSSHTVALKSDGIMWAWGNNSHGELGDGTTENKSAPVQVGSDADWQTVACGYDYTVALKSDGMLWAWGNNWFGQSGDGTLCITEPHFIFTLNADKALIITVPNGGEMLTTAENFTILWSSTNITEDVKIELYRGDTSVLTVAAAAPNTGSYIFTPPVTLGDGDDYRIRISAENGTVNDFSDGFFSITSSTDSDHDGLSDSLENAGCTFFDNPDSDADGLLDGIEDANHNGIVDTGETNPCNLDTDGDGMPDGWEVEHNLNPTINDAGDDADGDGITNLQEYLSGTDPQIASQWIIQIVESDNGMAIDDVNLALDKNDQPGIYYRIQTDPVEARFARFDGSTWSTDVITTVTSVCCGGDLAFDSNSYPRVAFTDYSGSASHYVHVYSEWDGTAWQTQKFPVFSTTGALQVDSSNVSHIAWYTGTNLEYRRWDGSSWQITTVDSAGDVGYATDLKLDDQDHIHISYGGWGHYLKYAFFDGSTWHVDMVDSEIGSANDDKRLQLDSHNNPMILYRDADNYLKIAKKEAGSWHVSTTSIYNETGRYGFVVDSHDHFHIAAFSRGMDSTEVKYYFYDGSSWKDEKIDTLNGTGALWLDMALAADGSIHIAYETPGNELRYAIRTNQMLLALPDTGQIQCYDNDGPIDCPALGEPFYGQDAQYQGSRSYTKLDANGNDLPNTAVEWAMVRDNVTGLIWEVKQAKDGTPDYANPHDADNIYTWYNSDPVIGTNHGTPGDGTDTEDFIAALNAANYGGYHDWRLPTVKELSLLVDRERSYPAIDGDFFPNTKSDYYSTLEGIWEIGFNEGYCPYSSVDGNVYVRAVRGGTGENPARFIVNGDGTVSDTATGLMWLQQSPGGYMTWQEALVYCEGLSLAGYIDWRLPNINELQSLFSYSSYPHFDPIAFPDLVDVWDSWWSSTTRVGAPEYVWYLNAPSGYVHLASKSAPYLVWPVRDISPSPTDSDHDGLSDSLENAGCTFFDNPDSDADGLLDGIEDANHNGIVDAGETNPCSLDSDNDGMPDGWEVEHNLNPTISDAGDDADGDGITNLQEYLLGTDPQVACHWIIQIVDPDNGVADDRFGSAAAIDGDYALVGVPRKDDLGVDSGLVRVYRHTGDHWETTGTLVGSDVGAYDQFGFSVALDGSYAVVGAYGDDDQGSNAGAAYVFELVDGSWQEVAKLVPANNSAGAYFGRSVSLSGDYIVVGAYADDVQGINSGSAYIYLRENGTWHEMARIMPDDGAADDRFGSAVSISGEQVLVGAYGKGDTGGAYIFQRVGDNWHEAAMLTPEATEAIQFGWSVSLSGDYAFIGAPHDEGHGSVFVYHADEQNWGYVEKLTSDGELGDNFGFSLSVSGNLAVVGAYLDDDNGDRAGSGYVYRLGKSGWTEVSKLLPSNGQRGDEYGKAVCLSGDTAVIGAPGSDVAEADAGAAYFYDFSVLAMPVSDDFESGDLSTLPWQWHGDGAWNVSGNYPFSGSFSAQVPLLDDNESALLEISCTCEAGEIGFWFAVDSEEEFDFLSFFIDGELQDNWSGVVAYTYRSYAVPEGEHTFSWQYAKDASTGAGADSAWIDDVSLPPMKTMKGNAAIDFNTDGIHDIALFYPAAGKWYIKDQSSPTYGTADCLPVPGDYNGDGTTDLAIMDCTRPDNRAKWYLDGIGVFIYGLQNWIPVPGDYNGDGITDAALFDPATGKWYIKGQFATIYGAGGIPVPGDYNGDGITDIAVFNPSNNKWYIKDIGIYTYGMADCIPVPADYDGDGKTDLAVIDTSRPDGMAKWYLRDQAVFIYGAVADTIPVPGDYNGDGRADPCLFHQDSGKWYCRNVGIWTYGNGGMIPLAGNLATRYALSTSGDTVW